MCSHRYKIFVKNASIIIAYYSATIEEKKR